MEFTCKYAISLAIFAILFGAFITVVCVYGIKPDFLKYKLSYLPYQQPPIFLQNYTIFLLYCQ